MIFGEILYNTVPACQATLNLGGHRRTSSVRGVMNELGRVSCKQDSAKGLQDPDFLLRFEGTLAPWIGQESWDWEQASYANRTAL